MSESRINTTCDTVGFEWAMIYTEILLEWHLNQIDRCFEER